MDVLSEEQLTVLNQAKVSMRLENEKYLRDHPELAKVTRAFVKTVLREKPENLNTHAYKFFVRDRQLVQQDIENI